MTDNLLFLRAILVSGSRNHHDLFQQAASASKVPLEIVEARDAVMVRQAVVKGADLLYLDGALASAEIEKVVSAARAAANPPFTVLLAGPEAAVAPFLTDAVALKPTRLEEARRLVERSTRVRTPSRVLVVDDSPTMRSIVRKILAATRFQFEVTEAAEGLAALKLARESEFDMVFLDYNMPGLNGLETVFEFQREKRRVSVVMISSTQDESIAERARVQGAAFLKKPFFPADIEVLLSGHYGLTALNPRRA